VVTTQRHVHSGDESEAVARYVADGPAVTSGRPQTHGSRDHARVSVESVVEAQCPAPTGCI